MKNRFTFRPQRYVYNYIDNVFDAISHQSLLGKLFLPTIVLLCITLIITFFGQWKTHLVLVIATILGFYMALNIWANDVANNMWPAVWSKAITITWAIIIAAIFEASGAIIAGWDVVKTIKWGIIDSSLVVDPEVFTSIMLATLFGSAVWINIATFTKSPVSATHSVIGGLIWAWVISSGFDVIVWSKIMQVFASWIISPLMGWCIAAAILWSIDTTIIHKESRHDAAKKWVPIYVAIMGGCFSSYLIMKWLKKVIEIPALGVVILGVTIAVTTYFVSRLLLQKYDWAFKNSKKSINSLFNIPLIFSAALLSFAHGANDVANAIGPLAAIYETTLSGDISLSANIPMWIMLVGAIGLAIGLGVYGRWLIKTVGNQITKLNQIRAYCVALSAAITVIIASLLGLPVSSTHIAVWGIFGIGIFRQWQKSRKGKNKEYIDHRILKSIVLSWLITLPCSALIAAISYTSIIYFIK